MRNNQNAAMHYVYFPKDKTALNEFDYDNEYCAEMERAEIREYTKDDFYEEFVSELRTIAKEAYDDKVRWMRSISRLESRYHKVEVFHCIKYEDFRVRVDTFYKDGVEKKNYEISYRSQYLKDRRLKGFVECIEKNANWTEEFFRTFKIRKKRVAL